MLTIFDYTTLAVIVLSSLHGAWRGFTSEIFFLFSWVIGFIVANRYSSILMPYIPTDWPGGTLTQRGISFSLIVISILFIVSIFSMILSQIIQVTGLIYIDYSLGIIFGTIRGMLLVVLLVAAAGFTELPKQGFWRSSLLRPYADQGVQVLKKFLPDKVTKYIRA
ncbi:MAG: CvpA family protein [Burkholderia sp.]|nr:CvpA family protein [Burkholderia sp.]